MGTVATQHLTRGVYMHSRIHIGTASERIASRLRKDVFNGLMEVEDLSALGKLGKCF